jgi:hypothetical protein
VNCGSDVEVAAAVWATRAAVNNLNEAASSETAVAALYLLDLAALTTVLCAKVAPAEWATEVVLSDCGYIDGRQGVDEFYNVVVSRRRCHTLIIIKPPI